MILLRVLCLWSRKNMIETTSWWTIYQMDANVFKYPSTMISIMSCRTSSPTSPKYVHSIVKSRLHWMIRIWHHAVIVQTSKEWIFFCTIPIIYSFNCLLVFDNSCSNRMKCACFRKTLDQAIYNRDPLVLEKQRNRYSMSHILKTMAYQRKRLLHPVSSGIYECNSKCSCHRQHCTNRLTQQGVFVQLQLFKDKEKGWGLRTLHDLPRGTFICEYVGEMLTSDQGHERAQTMDDKYQTSLDLIKQIRYATDDDHDPIEDDDDDDDDDNEEPYVIDGSLFSNLGKYFNHSCDPNMYIQNVFIESHDLHFPHLAIFTSSHVKAGQGKFKSIFSRQFSTSYFSRGFLSENIVRLSVCKRSETLDEKMFYLELDLLSVVSTVYTFFIGLSIEQIIGWHSCLTGF